MTHFDPTCHCVGCIYKAWDMRLRYSVRGPDDHRSQDVTGEVDENGTVTFRPSTWQDQLDRIQWRASLEGMPIHGEVE